MKPEPLKFGEDCKHWDDCDFRNSISCDSELCDEFEDVMKDG